MKYTKIALILGIVLLQSSFVFSQYTGGDTDGHSMNKIDTLISCSLPMVANIYMGGNADGHSMNKIDSLISCSLPTVANIYMGGNADGHSMNKIDTLISCSLPTVANIYMGGNADGHSMNKIDTLISCSLPTVANIYMGGNADGNASVAPTSCLTVIEPCPIDAKAGSDTSICVGSTITLTASGGNSYVWQTGDPADTLSTLTVNPGTSTTYTVNVIGDTCSKTATVTITVNSKPTANISGTTSLCRTDSTTLTASGGSVYLWNTGDTTAAITVNPITNSLYSVKVSNGGCSDTSSVTVTRFIAAPITGTSIVCTGDSTTLTASAPGATSYSWNNGDTTATIKISPAADSLYKVTVSNGSCSDTASVTITVASPPTVSITGTTTLCSGTNTTLKAVGGTSYLWNNGATTDTIKISPTMDTTYIVTAFIGSCSDTESVKMTVNSPPVITSSDVSITSGTSTIITASATGNSIYLWTSSPDLSCTACQSPTATPTANTTYYIMATSSNGCMSMDSVVVTILEPLCEVYVPNAFSPNGDGQNEFLRVHGDCIKELSFIIYDRWGEKVFEAKDISSAMTKGWDGIYKGKELNSAVFVYYLNATLNNAEGIERKGNISLIR